MNALVSLHRVTVRFGLHRALSDLSLSIRPGQVWAVVGDNGSGKTLLTELLAGRRRPNLGEVRFADGLDPLSDIHIVSFEEQFRVMEAERRRDESWLLEGPLDEGSTVGDFIRRALGGEELPAAGHAAQGRSDAAFEKLLRRFHIQDLRHRGLRFLSTGEMRKTLLCRALLGDPQLVILDDPFDGLDLDAQGEIRRVIAELADGRRTLVVVTPRRGEIPPVTTHIARLEEGQLLFAGPRDSDRPDGRQVELSPRWIPGTEAAEAAPEPLVRMDSVSVSYGDRTVLQDIDWEVHAGQVWHILGPNGSGKSTLLSLVDGSNPKAYGQAIRLFGRPRGSGESVWEIKRRIGFVSAGFHNGYPRRSSAREAILSGFRDSAGLFEKPTGLQLRRAEEWLGILGLSARGEDWLREFSYGEQRAILVARAMVKMPPLLIADEPSQGLDDAHSAFVLALLDKIAAETDTAILYVSHKPEFTLERATHRLWLVPAEAGRRAVVERL